MTDAMCAGPRGSNAAIGLPGTSLQEGRLNMTLEYAAIAQMSVGVPASVVRSSRRAGEEDRG
jgi:hypothetical protein